MSLTSSTQITLGASCKSVGIDTNNNIYFTNDTNFLCRINAGTNTINTSFFNIGRPHSCICIDSSNNIIVALMTDTGGTRRWSSSNSTQLPDRNIQIRKLTISGNSVTANSLIADRVHSGGLPGGPASFWPANWPDYVIINPDGNIYVAFSTCWWWCQPNIMRITQAGTQTVLFHYNGNGNDGPTYWIRAMIPKTDSSGFYTIEQSKVNFRNSSGTMTSLYTLTNRNDYRMHYLDASNLVIIDRTVIPNIYMIFHLASNTITKTLNLGTENITIAYSDISTYTFYVYDSVTGILKDLSLGKRVLYYDNKLGNLDEIISLGITETTVIKPRITIGSDISFGWNTNANGTGTYYPSGCIYAGTDDLILYAIWTPRSFVTSIKWSDIRK